MLASVALSGKEEIKEKLNVRVKGRKATGVGTAFQLKGAS